MAGSQAGGKQAAETNKKKYGADFYAKIGAIGGAASNNGGFAQNRELARTAGAKGGKKSKPWSRMKDYQVQYEKLETDPK